MQADTPAAIMLPLVARFLASVVSTELDEFVIRAKPHEFVISTARYEFVISIEAQRSGEICIFPTQPRSRTSHSRHEALCPDGKSQLS